MKINKKLLITVIFLNVFLVFLYIQFLLNFGSMGPKPLKEYSFMGVMVDEIILTNIIVSFLYFLNPFYILTGFLVSTLIYDYRVDPSQVKSTIYLNLLILGFYVSAVLVSYLYYKAIYYLYYKLKNML